MPCYLTCIDPDKNQKRFYYMHVAPTLFNGWSLVREWGRIGQAGTVKFDPFDSEEAAQRQLERLKAQKLKKGYQE